ncbi:carbohydrate ABC transporter permease [Algisphaera agarilytica]|uniref:ABC-type glycerol-3-phosphate transport system permease component n=1 Tax=Algisphaera agarilytica TaxID=1385975 RepID=A0A7X0H4L0_9BACT|nr:carbohydrate ABC transporter permease [Algisphaera agarilytica]MBB6429124.1 ABC-type glycerol-3-phosphate transport system permease component [Algisphaera agarilytica]
MLTIGALVFLMPLAWMFVTAVKPAEQTMTMPPQWIPVSWDVAESGQTVFVHVDQQSYDAAVSAGDDSVEVNFAYQWVVDRGGDAVPVLVSDKVLNSTHKINAHWRSIAHDDRPVRILEPIEGIADEDLVRVYIYESEVMGFPHKVMRKDLVLHYDQTQRATQRSYSFAREIEVGMETLEKRYIAWDDRKRLAHTETEARFVSLESLRSSADVRWGNFGQAVEEMGQFPRYLSNTLILCVLTVGGTVFSSAVVAYGFSRIDWPGRDKIFVIVLATMMIPFPVTMVPLYGLFRELGWIGTLKPLWVPAFFASAFNVFLLRQFFRTIPKELSEAARIDGCNEWRIFWQIILPLAKPALTVVALFQFLATWNDYLGPLIYLTDQSDFTLALGLQFFQSQHGGTQWHLLMAASCLIVMPVLILFFMAQRTFVEGVSMSGLKG